MKKKNEGFVCTNCGYDIDKAMYSCRNHCPYCFVSVHVDEEIPGDRKSGCLGIMYPIQYEIYNQDINILFQCYKCGKQHYNKENMDDNLSILDAQIEKFKFFVN